MKIHSSSLASIPARYKANNHNEAQNTRVKNNTDSPQDSSVLASAPQPPIQDRNAIKAVDLPQASKVFQHTSINSNAHQALNAYIQETNQPLKNQRSEIIAGIDFFV